MSQAIVGLILFIAGAVGGYCLLMLRLRRGVLPAFLLRRLFDYAPNSFLVLDHQGRCLYWNPDMVNRSGIPAERVVGQFLANVLPADQPVPAPESVRVALAGGVYQESLAANRFGERAAGWQKAFYWPIREQNGKTSGVIVSTQRMGGVYRLYEEARRQAAILAAVKDAVFGVDTSFYITDWNQGATALYGYTADEAMGQRLPDLLGMVATPEALDHMAAVLHEKGIWQEEVRQRNKAGETMFIDNVTSCLYNESGVLIGYIGVNRDITELRQTQQRLLQQNEYLTALNETTLALMNRLDVRDLLETILAHAERLTGTSNGSIHLAESNRTELVTKISTGFFANDAGSRLSIAYSKGVVGQAFQTGQAIVVADYPHWPQRDPDPALDALNSAFAIPLRSGDQIVGVLALAHFEVGRVFSDEEVKLLTRFAELASIALDNARLFTSAQHELADRKRVENDLRVLNAELDQRVRERTAELQREQTRLQTILDDMGEGVIYSRNGSIQYANRALAELTLYWPDELVGRSYGLLIGPMAAVEADRLFAERLVEPGATWRGETDLTRKDGSTFNAAMSVTRIMEPEGEATGLIAIVRDITEEKQLQAQKSRFIAHASHELRTPLTGIKTRLYLLRRQPERAGDHLLMLEQATNQMTSLVEDLLESSRFERGVIELKRQPVVLQDLIKNVVEMQRLEAEQRKITLTTEMPAEALCISADPNRLNQVFVNLLVNAINYTLQEGQITVQLSTEPRDKETCAVIRVLDTGVGIAPEYLPRIFEPFFRASEGSNRGTGLGLSIVKEIVELHGGTITVDSRVNAGSVFTVRLRMNA